MLGSVRCSSSELHSFSLTSLVGFEDLAASVDSSAVSFEAPSGCSWSLKMSQKQRGDGNIPSPSQGLTQTPDHLELSSRDPQVTMCFNAM